MCSGQPELLEAAVPLALGLDQRGLRGPSSLSCSVIQLLGNPAQVGNIWERRK